MARSEIIFLTVWNQELHTKNTILVGEIYICKDLWKK